ncbi:DUF5017 domain-containing protein [uncultured Bacteroides sp.]|uniref:DUF5017 domain-containing protein n=1 Tax=uncultured Bacteroides sp. TaxID=162156 RepID=UPI000822A1E5|nr:DUF5017 domain-containing protein [uncultured Bacteroides sp.]SCH80313.1 Uncharacterised protein [uncultured Bacteroides sp.]
MNRILLFLFLILNLVIVASCNPDQVGDLYFDATIRNAAQEIYVGDEVIFDFSGNPDYLVFYSGEEGKKYAYKDRLKVDVESVSLSYTIGQQYTDDAYQNRETMEIYISTDFGGDYSVKGIENATWQKLSGIDEGALKVPVCSETREEKVSDEGDLSAFKDQNFYLAFRYQTPAVPNLEKSQPKINIEPISLMKKAGETTTVMNNPQKEFGFSYVFVEGKSQNNFSTNDSRLLFQPQNTTGVAVDVWAISQSIDVTAVSPDQGEPITALNMRASSYTYRYNTPGEYTVTFVARNANLWNSESVVKELKVIVKEKQ